MEMRVKGVGVKRSRTLTEAEWEKARMKVREEHLCPCGHYAISECMCKGACGCHWREIDVIEDGVVVDKDDSQADESRQLI